MEPLLETCSKNFIDFYKWSQIYLKKHNKKSTISNTEYIVAGGGRCGGACFSDEIKVAFKNKMFEEIYVHEFSHMQQQIENPDFWNEGVKFWEKFKKKQAIIKDWNDLIAAIELERDCERRALNHSKKWALFDNKDYAKKANAYLYYYHYVFLTGKWAKSEIIYDPHLLEVMPDKLASMKSFRQINMDLMQLFEYLF
jgi:hypothetical protein